MRTKSRILTRVFTGLVLFIMLFMTVSPGLSQPTMTGPTTLALPIGLENPVFGAFNELGQAVGWASDHIGSVDNAILWNEGESPKILGEGWVLSINNLGQIAGMHNRQVALWQPGIEEPLIIPTPNAVGFSGAVSINESGVMVGCYGNVWFFGTNPNYAFIYDSNTGIFTDLAVPLGKSCAYDINDLGQVVGESVNGIFVFTPGQGFNYLTSGPDTGVATAINNMGWVAGYSNDADGHQHAFLWKPDDIGLTFLGEDTFDAKGINDYGMVTGDLNYYDDSYGYWINRGFIWSDGVLQQLPIGSSSYTEAWRISNRMDGTENVAYIAGIAVIADNKQPVFWKVTLPAITPQDQITYIKDQTIALVKGEGNALSSKLDAAANQLAKGETKPAVNLLGAFKNQTEALVRSGRLGQSEGQSLIDLANKAITTIQAMP